MRVVIEMSNEELKRHLHDYSEAYTKPGQRVGVLIFHEYKYEHPSDCKEDHELLRKEGSFCTASALKPNASGTTFRVLQINP